MKRSIPLAVRRLAQAAIDDICDDVDARVALRVQRSQLKQHVRFAIETLVESIEAEHTKGDR